MSGQRRTARLEIRARLLRDRKASTGCRLDSYVGEVERQNRRRCCKSGSECRPRHADRAEIVGMTGVFVGLTAVGVGDRRQQNAGVGFAAAKAFEVNVAKRQREVNREREQREGGSLPNFGAEPVHSETRRKPPLGLMDPNAGTISNFSKGSITQQRSALHELLIARSAAQLIKRNRFNR